MRLTSVVALTVLCAALAGASTAGSSTAPSASVANVAVVIFGNTVTNFELNLYDCPAREEMTVVEWEAEQPNRAPGNGIAASGQPYGASTGEQVQHLTLSAGGNFISGERWVGSGIVSCGAVLIPVSGSGTTKSVNGV
jgi:hypothetical protein